MWLFYYNIITIEDDSITSYIVNVFRKWNVLNVLSHYDDYLISNHTPPRWVISVLFLMNGHSSLGVCGSNTSRKKNTTIIYYYAWRTKFVTSARSSASVSHQTRSKRVYRYNVKSRLKSSRKKLHIIFYKSKPFENNIYTNQILDFYLSDNSVDGILTRLQ